MADANTDIRIFPKKKMKAADMAYVVDAACLGSGVLHGCLLSITDGLLSITDGRILIKGRLAYVSGGTIPNPEGASGSDTYYILAVCDLMAENPFTIDLVDSNGKEALDTRVTSTSDEGFNAGNGVRYVQLGTVTFDATSGTYSNLVKIDSSGWNTKAIETKMTTLNNNVESLTSWRKYLYKRAHDKLRFRTKDIDINGITIAAGKVATITYYNFYGVTIFITKSESSTPTITGYNRVWLSPSGVNLGGAEPQILPGSDTDSYLDDTDKYGVPKNVDASYVHLGIIGVRITNATTGGKNAANCDLVGFFTIYNENTVKIHNRGSSAAVVRILQRSLYTRAQ